MDFPVPKVSHFRNGNPRSVGPRCQNAMRFMLCAEHILPDALEEVYVNTALHRRPELQKAYCLATGFVPRHRR